MRSPRFDSEVCRAAPPPIPGLCPSTFEYREDPGARILRPQVLVKLLDLEPEGSHIGRLVHFHQAAHQAMGFSLVFFLLAARCDAIEV